jgi:hypothetical protein
MLSFLLLLIVSCADRTLEAPAPVSSESVQTRSIPMSLELDSVTLERLSAFQSNSEIMLIQQIIYTDSHYILNLSRSEAAELCVPDSLYDKVLTYVSQLNAP